MREILFRGIAKETIETVVDTIEKGEFVYGFYLFHEGTHGISTTIAEPNVGADSRTVEVFVPVEPETVGQYTGLKDKNNKKIFEGDIVEGYGRKNDKIGVFDVELCDCAWYPFLFVDEEESVVIGNIYKNPELIK